MQKEENMLKVNEIYTVRIEETNIFANGVCHIDNVVVFVENALQGEECEIKITKLHSRYAFAECVNILKASDDRLIPQCQHFRECGGCSFLHTKLKKENEIKELYVKSSFKKQHFDVKVEKIVCPVSEKYRNKVVLFYSGVGFGYMKQGTNEIVSHKSCVLNEDIFDKIADYVANQIEDEPIRAIYLRKNSQELAEIMVSIIVYKKCNISPLAQKIKDEFSCVKTVLYGLSNEKEFVLENVRFEKITGNGYISDKLCGLDFRISPKSFYQVNHSCAELLYEKAIELAKLDSKTVCADLFCGTGTIGIISAKKTGAMIYGVEIVEEAIEDAKFNAKINGVENIHLQALDAGKFNRKVDVCIIDPPRKGCSDLMIDTLNRLSPKRIVYVSCNVDTMVRDIKSLSDKYIISSPVSVFNLFPRTSHVESVVCLTRRLDNELRERMN